MTWFQVDDHLSDHRKVRRLGEDKLAAVGLWTLCGSWCGANLSEGFIPAEVVDRWDPGLKIAARLVEVELWSEDASEGERGFRFHEWGEYQRSKDAVLRQRNLNRLRQKRYRDRREAELLASFDNDERNALLQNDITVDRSNDKVLTSQDVTRYVSQNPRSDSVPAGRGSRNALDDASSNASRNGDVTGYLSLPSHNSLKKHVQAKPARDKQAEEDAHFAEFWKHYPRKKQKQDARTAWLQMRRKGVSAEEMIRASKAHGEHHRQRGTEETFIKLAGGWLRGRVFDDWLPEAEPEPDLRAPEEILRELWRDANASEVARLAGVPFVDREPRPSETTPRDEWVRDYRRGFIETHRDAALTALRKNQPETVPNASEADGKPVTPATLFPSVSVDSGRRKTA